MTDLIKDVERGEWFEGGWTNPLWPQSVPEATARNAYQGDLDAAVDLLEAVLPGWFWFMGKNIHDNTCYARITPPGNLPDFGAKHDTNPARALLLAILKALAAKETTDD